MPLGNVIKVVVLEPTYKKWLILLFFFFGYFVIDISEIKNEKLYRYETSIIHNDLHLANRIHKLSKIDNF